MIAEPLFHVLLSEVYIHLEKVLIEVPLLLSGPTCGR